MRHAAALAALLATLVLTPARPVAADDGLVTDDFHAELVDIYADSVDDGLVTDEYQDEIGANLADSDNDDLSDAEEAHYGTEPNRYDTDGDWASDGEEINLHGTNPLVPDIAFVPADADDDGIQDGNEANYGTDPGVWDSDGDGLSDGDEVWRYGTDPLVHNSQSGRPDRDGDGLYDDDEVNVYGTDPDNVNTDGDRYSDGEEVYYGHNPTDICDPPGYGYCA